jgi:hypothetical protein
MGTIRMSKVQYRRRGRAEGVENKHWRHFAAMGT